MDGMIILHFVEHDSKGMIISIIYGVPAKDRHEIENGHSIPSCITKSSLKSSTAMRVGSHDNVYGFNLSTTEVYFFLSLLLLDEFWAALRASVCIRKGVKTLCPCTFLHQHYIIDFSFIFGCCRFGITIKQQSYEKRTAGLLFNVPQDTQ